MELLVVAYYFPPESSSGSFRPLYFANHLIKLGCQVTVLTGKEECYLIEQPVDNALLDALDRNVDVIRTKVARPRELVIALKTKIFTKSPKEGDKKSPIVSVSCTDKPSTFQKFKDFITDLLAVPDPHVGWLPWAVFKGRKIIKSEKIDVIWATGSPWTCFLIGTVLKKLTGKPLVLDYRDPWGANPNMLLKNKYVAAVEKKIEKIVVGQADLITANTKELRDDFLLRFPFLTKKQVVTLPNGFEKFHEPIVCENHALTLTHAGAVYFSRNPVNLLQAVFELLHEKAIPEGQIKIKFVGGISIDDPVLTTLLATPELKGVVDIYPRMEFEKAIRHQLTSDILFLLQPGFPLQIPRKLYEYISLRKPILAITDKNGATANIIEKNNFGTVVSDTKEDLKDVVRELWQDWQAGNISQPVNENSAFYLNSNISHILYTHLSELTGKESDDAAC